MSFLRRVASPACVALVGLSLLFVVPDVRAQEEEAAEQEQSWDRWTPELQMRFRAIGQTAMSPDGSLVAYTVRWPEMEGEDSEYRTHIWLASTDGSRKSQFTRGEETASSPSFSPDGEFLAFTTSRSGDNQVWVMPVSGGEAWQVTKSPTGVAGYRWSPDGSQMAFTARDEESDEEEAAKKEKRYVIRVDQDFKYGHLYVTDVGDGGDGAAEATRLTEGEFHVTSFTWAPDGTQIAFSHQPDPRLNTGSLSDLSIVSLADAQVVPLVNLGGTETSPRWAPGGDWIAFVGTGDQAEPIGLGDVYIVRPDGSQVTRLADTPDRTGGIQAWSMDGADVLVAQAVGVGRHLVRVPVDGSPAATVTSGDGVYGSFSFASDADAMAFTYQEPELPADVHVATRSGADDTRLTEVNADVPLPEMGRTEVLRWTSDDGTPVEGLLTYPVGYEEGRRYPLILNVHGGPAGVFSRSFTGAPSIYMLQSFAQDGYAVLRPNPRGSTGYGKEFRYANFQDWGFGDYDDLDSGVDLAIEMGVAHADSLLLMGWSYGGYMTSFAVTRTDRFRAASMGAGLPNLISMITTTDIQDYLAGHMGGEYWEDYEMYERHSAIYQLDKIVTPMQVIHGERDLRVPFTQGQEFYRALSRKGVPTEMIVLPRTPHGPREPKLLMSVQPLIKEWFEKYLRPVRITSDTDGAGG